MLAGLGAPASALAQRSSGPRASSSDGGVTYHPTAAFPRNTMSFTLSGNSGTIRVLNATSGPRAGTDYTITVECTRFLPHGVVYWGGLVTASAPHTLNEKGRWAFGYFEAGGPHRGRVAGVWAPAHTCYGPAAKTLVGPSFPVLTGTIIVADARRS
jgi:hypothetical protein